MTDEHLYEIASAEVAAGNIRPGLRAKAFSESQGEEHRAQALYLKYRVGQLAEEQSAVLRAHAKAQVLHKRQQDQRKKDEYKAAEAERRLLAQAEGMTSIHYILLGLISLLFALILWKLV